MPLPRLAPMPSTRPGIVARVPNTGRAPRWHVPDRAGNKQQRGRPEEWLRASDDQRSPSSWSSRRSIQASAASSARATASGPRAMPSEAALPIIVVPEAEAKRGNPVPVNTGLWEMGSGLAAFADAPARR
jgi:hypothetical protein